MTVSVWYCSVAKLLDGGIGNDTLVGTGTLDGGAGADLLLGGEGNVSLIASAAGITVVLVGVDVATVSVHWFLVAWPAPWSTAPPRSRLAA